MTKQIKRSKYSGVMTIANNLVKQGYNHSIAMIKAWILVKLPQKNSINNKLFISLLPSKY